MSKSMKSMINSCRDITENKSIQDGERCGRLRYFDENSLHAPTLLKSQSRMAKDTCVFKTKKNRYLMPSEEVLKHLMGIPKEFNLDCVSSDVASEIIGQSVDVLLHRLIIKAVRKHIDEYVKCHLKN